MHHEYDFPSGIGAFPSIIMQTAPMPWRGIEFVMNTSPDEIVREHGGLRRPRQATFLPTSYSFHPTPYLLHPTPDTLHPTPYTLHPPPYTLHPTPYTLHPKPYTLHPTPHTPHPTPSTPNTQDVLGKCPWCAKARRESERKGERERGLERAGKHTWTEWRESGRARLEWRGKSWGLGVESLR